MTITYISMMRRAYVNRWMFLAKSHTKSKQSAGTGSNAASNLYGCVFCVDTGKSTMVFGQIPTLMDHIKTEHQTMRNEIALRNRCVVGEEDHNGFYGDIHLPFGVLES